MKKIVIILAIVMLFMFFNKREDEETVKIPSSAIRFRVLANSNSTEDQNTKENVRDKMQKELYSLLENTNTISEARYKINNNLSNFDLIVKNELKNKDYSYNISYGMHYFPEKTYKGITYEEGEYESLLVTLGSGCGDNWWCVLFPPLCVLEAEETKSASDVEYKFFIKEIIEKYF